jgi:hypothetical protein
MGFMVGDGFDAGFKPSYVSALMLDALGPGKKSRLSPEARSTRRAAGGRFPGLRRLFARQGYRRGANTLPF